MGQIGNIVDSAIDAGQSGFGQKNGASLQDFLNKFSSTSGNYANIVDPYSQFSLKMKFYPNEYSVYGTKPERKSTFDKVVNSLKQSAKNAVTSAADNLTGGLVSSIMNSKVKVSKAMASNENAGVTTFLECLAAANMIAGTEDDFFGDGAGEAVRPLVLQLGAYCQSITIPHIQTGQNGNSMQSNIGSFSASSSIVKPDNNELQMNIINTKIAIHERIFYPWMREVTLPFWSYASQPYTTATIVVDFAPHNNVKYVFTGCRPTKINALQGDQGLDDSNLVRNVTMTFDFMFVQSKIDEISEKPGSKLLSTGRSLLGSAMKMVNA